MVAHEYQACQSDNRSDEPNARLFHHAILQHITVTLGDPESTEPRWHTMAWPGRARPMRGGLGSGCHGNGTAWRRYLEVNSINRPAKVAVLNNDGSTFSPGSPSTARLIVNATLMRESGQ